MAHNTPASNLLGDILLALFILFSLGMLHRKRRKAYERRNNLIPRRERDLFTGKFY